MKAFIILMKPELVVTAIIFLLLFTRIGKAVKNETLLPLIQALLLVNFLQGFFYVREGSLFDGMFQATAIMHFQKSILSLGVYLIALLCSDWLKKTAHLAEFFMLMLSALLGMYFLISAQNLLLFYLALELATIPIAAMSNFDLDKRIASEAAMKMILSSAFSSGILLFGISLLYGTTGTLHFSALPHQLDASPMQLLAFVFVFTAFAFKLSIVPFHLWTADVYEGSPVAVTAFLSVVSKGAIAFVLTAVLFKVFHPMQEAWYNMLVLLAIVTMVIGNLFALRQQNIKRFLAFSSITQVGFILVGISSGLLEGWTAVVFFILVYVFSNLAAFGVAAVISEQAGKENIDDYRGLYKRNPFLSWIMALALFSLAGIPPTAGFFGKLFLLSSGAAAGSYTFITLAALNMIISLFYYLKVVRAIFIDKNEKALEKIRINPPVKLGLIICGAGILFTGLAGWIYDYIRSLL
jgi:NADH-quinone oxidoreductase subunit N